jgi:hypothetical protein
MTKTLMLFGKYFTLLILMLGLVCGSAPVEAWNQLPLLTDAPQTIPAGQVQLAVGLQYLDRSNSAFSSFATDFNRDVLSLPTLGLNFGLGRRVELQLEYEVLFVEEPALDIKERWKSGDISFFTKINALAEHPHLPAVGLKLGAKLPNADNTYLVGTDETDLAFAVLFAKTFAPVTVTANMGFIILGNPFQLSTQDDLLSYALACDVPWRTNLTSRVEIAGQALGTAQNQRASAVAHLFFQDGSLTWNLTTRVGLLENSETWGLAGGVRWSFDWLKRWAN